MVGRGFVLEYVEYVVLGCYFLEEGIVVRWVMDRIGVFLFVFIVFGVFGVIEIVRFRGLERWN